MFSVRKILTASVIALVAALPLSVSAATVADWQFSEANVSSGSLNNGNAVIRDLTGNGNDLSMRTYGSSFASTVSFSEDCAFGKEGSIHLNGSGTTGVDFVTVNNAPINKNQFANGYTIEIVYKMPIDWTQGTDRWTSLLSRLGHATAIENDREGENVSSLIHVSKCKEIQFIPASKDNINNLPSNVWSVAMDKAENWYSIVITHDGTTYRTFVNGCESFRDQTSTTMKGLYADPNDGRFRVGARILENGTPYRFTRGNIQHIRISDTALSREDWLIPNPEDLMGEYGDNSPFTETPDDRYNMVFVPDTQNTTKFEGQVLDKATQWLIDNKDFANIEAIVSLGDNVEDFHLTPQWDQITKTYTTLAENGFRTIVPTGNHDSGNNNNFWYYNTHFGPDTNFANLAADYMLEYSPSGTGGIADISAGSFDYKLIYVDMYHLFDSAEMSWLRRMLTTYATSPVIMVMHDIQECSDTVPNETKLSANGLALWNIVKDYDNVFMMVGGHSHGYGVLKLENAYGNPVYSILADYQFSYNGGNALCKFAEFDEKGGMIRVSTFSPYVATLSEDEKTFFDVNYMTGKGNYDELELDFFSRFSFKEYMPGENIMTNPSFEDENGNFSLKDWNSAETNAQFGDPYTTGHCFAVNPSTAISFDYWGSKTLVEKPLSTTIPDGEWAFGSKWNDGKEGLCSLKRYVPVEPGKTYLISYKVKHKTGSDGGYLITSLVANNGDDENPDTATSAGFIGTEWTEVKRVFTATEDTDHVLFWFRWLGNGSDGLNGPYWFFDDFSVSETKPKTIINHFYDNLEISKSGNDIVIKADINETVLPVLIAVGIDAYGQIVDINTVENGTAVLSDATITKVKVFCWESMTNIKPLIEADTPEIK